MSAGRLEVSALASDTRCGIYRCEIMYKALTLILGAVSNLPLPFPRSATHLEVVLDILDGMGQ